MDFMAQVQNYMMSQQYESLLKKANFKILVRLTLAGAVYITFVCLLPEFLILKYNVPFYFGGTSLLIIVVVTMDFMAQVQNYMMSQQYESLLKKANFKPGQ